MMITFEAARLRVDEPTDLEGYQDDQHYLLILTYPPIDDTVVLVDRETGAVTRPPRWGIEDKLDAMTPVRSPGDNPPVVD